jgi:hypothetical protein
MRRRAAVAALVLVLAAAAGSTAWWRHAAKLPATVTLHFHPVVGSEPLVLGEPRYANPGGAGRFAVRDFQFFVANIRLVGAGTVYAEPDSYHLVRFDGPGPGHAIVLQGVPRGDYTRLEFGIGVDPAANGAITMRGDLDPNGRMAWTWDVGYKFVLFEGALLRDGTSRPLVYHVGFDENYTVVATAVHAEIGPRGEARLDLRVDLLRLFTGAATIDMAALPTVKFDRADAALLARNYAGMIEPM